MGESAAFDAVGCEHMCRFPRGVWAIPARTLLTATLLLALPSAGLCHTLLDPESAHALLSEITRYQKASQSGKTREARADALFAMGGKVQTLVGLLNQDVDAHGIPGPLTVQVANQLAESEINVTWSQQRRRYGYDMEAFRRYSVLAPNGAHAAEARFQVLSVGFYATLDLDPAKVSAGDLPAVIAAVEQEQRFLRDYPNDARAKEVSFYLGVDCYRLSRNLADAAQAVGYRRCARETLQAVASHYPDSIEARAAGSLLESLDRDISR